MEFRASSAQLAVRHVIMNHFQNAARCLVTPDGFKKTTLLFPFNRLEKESFLDKNSKGMVHSFIKAFAAGLPRI
jgi:hypothetical protein